MSDTDSAQPKKTLINTVLEELNKEQFLQKLIEPILDYTKTKIKPYYITLMVVLITIICLLLVILYIMLNK
jgi:hypothetical protein